MTEYKISYVASARGDAFTRELKKTRASKVREKKWLIACFKDIRQQIEPQLREQGCPNPATEAEVRAAVAVGYSLEGIRSLQKRARRREKRKLGALKKKRP